MANKREVVLVDLVRGRVELVARDRGQCEAASGDHADGLEQLRRGGGLRHQAIGPGHTRDQRQRGVLHGGVEDYAWRVGGALQSATQGDPVAVEQTLLHEDDVRAGAPQKRLAVPDAAGRADRHEAGFGAQQHREAGANGGLGIDDRDAGHRARRSQPVLQPFLNRT
jgi:hypothetical protein